MSEPVPICLGCSNFRQLYDNGKATCRAFPRGIPESIWTNKIIHEKPFPGDGGIRFQDIQPDDGTNDELVQQRDELKKRLPDLKENSKYFAPVDQAAQYADAETYAVYNNGRVYAGKDLTKNLKVGVPVLRKPVAVFRDFLERPDTRETTIIEEYIGLIRQVDGKVKTVYLLVNRNFLIKVRVLEKDDEDEILNQLSGSQIYSAY